MEDELMKLYADTKFEVGQTVYRVYETRKNIEQKVTCDVCLGTGKITYKGYRCNCPKCNGRGELVTDSKEVTLREIDVPRKVTAIRLIADKNKDGLLRYTLDAPQGYCSSKGALEKELFAAIEEAQAYCDEEATNDVCKEFAMEICKGY